MSTPMTRVDLRDDRDVVIMRQKARVVAEKLGFEPQDQIRIASAASEIGRHASKWPGGASAEFLVDGDPAALAIRFIGQPADALGSKGARPDLSALLGDPILDGVGRMMDAVRIESSADAGPGARSSIVVAKALPRRPSAVAATAAARRIADELAELDSPSLVEDLIRQNHELLRVLDELHAREAELARLNRELEETNRGVLALLSELEAQAESLKQASELKTRFLSNVSHELRTPLTSVISLARLLLDRTDGELNGEQDRQVRFIVRAAHDLSGMVNDLLDLARIESGREEVSVEPVALTEFFGVMRGMLRPLLPADGPVDLVFDDASSLPVLWTDEGKLAQVVRNLVSNALKFTESGEVRVTARPAADDPQSVEVCVQDTGIGIAAEHFDRVFEEFGQIDSPLQRRTKGTGLGLPLARNLCRLLGGRLDLASEPGKGSTFTARLLVHHPASAGRPAEFADRPPSAAAVNVEANLAAGS